MIVTVGGLVGAGKSTLGKGLAKKYGLDYISAGQVMRDLAKQKNMSLQQYSSIAEENPEISKALKVRAIPTLIGFKDGEEVARSIGNKSYKALAQFFEGILTGEEVKTSGLTMTDRVLRFFAGIVLLFIAWWGNNSVVLYTISVIVIFSAFYDRCPIWQTLTIWISNLVHRKKSKE